MVCGGMAAMVPGLYSSKPRKDQTSLATDHQKTSNQLTWSLVLAASLLCSTARLTFRLSGTGWNGVDVIGAFAELA